MSGTQLIRCEHLFSSFDPTHSPSTTSTPALYQQQVPMTSEAKISKNNSRYPFPRCLTCSYLSCAANKPGWNGVLLRQSLTSSEKTDPRLSALDKPMVETPMNTTQDACAEGEYISPDYICHALFNPSVFDEVLLKHVLQVYPPREIPQRREEKVQGWPQVGSDVPSIYTGTLTTTVQLTRS